MRTLILSLILIGAGLTAAEGDAKAKPKAPTVTVLTWTAEVIIPQAPVAGKPLDVDLNLTPADKAPKAVRLWVGAENGRGSTKVKAEPEKAGAYCVGVEVPNPIPAEAKLWISLENEAGENGKASVDLPKATAEKKAE